MKGRNQRRESKEENDGKEGIERRMGIRGRGGWSIVGDGRRLLEN
jgi:hypothetical protein